VLAAPRDTSALYVSRPFIIRSHSSSSSSSRISIYAAVTGDTSLLFDRVRACVQRAARDIGDRRRDYR